MLELSSIKNTVMQVADAITAAIGIESEIVDNNLKIIGGTGRYVKKIGAYEENGDLNSPYLYGVVLREGREYICLDASSDEIYHPVENELAEIACPIQIESQIIGIIGLVAFTEDQRQKITSNQDSLLNFLRRMSELIASKLIESQSNSKLAIMLENMPEGLLAMDSEGNIFSCNFTSEVTLMKNREQLLNMNISNLFPKGELSPKNIKSHDQKEVIYKNDKADHRLIVNIVPIPEVGTMLLFEDYESVARNIKKMTHIDTDTTFDDIYGESRQMVEVKERAKQVAENDSTVLITGESGTGKELFARAIHAASGRSNNMFIAINSAAIPDTLLESELFGYEKGSFTGAGKDGKPGKFELANHGTLFLDEIGDMPLHLQVKLLRVLQNRTIERIGGIAQLDIDVRIIAATNKNLEEMIERNEFREDLYFRLNVIPLNISPLRERQVDIEPMLHKALERFNRMLDKHIEGFEQNSLNTLKNYSWPGNIRELENAIEYSVNMENSSLIQFDNLPDRIKRNLSRPNIEGGRTLKEQTDHAQKIIITECLEITGTSREGKKEAARILGISESSLYRKISELNI